MAHFFRIDRATARVTALFIVPDVSNVPLDENSEAVEVSSEQAALYHACTLDQEPYWEEGGLAVRARTIPVEELWTRLRTLRDSLLTETDPCVLADYPFKKETDRAAALQAVLDYRQALRDLPQNTTDPANPVWPEKPGTN